MAGAFTSDAKSRWGAEWLTWPGYGKFWTQVVRQLMRRTPPGGLQLAVTRHGPRSLLSVDASEESGEFLNGGEAEVLVTDPSLGSTRIPLRQTAPGRYEGQLEAAQPGAWNLDFSIRRDGQPAAQQSRAIVTGEAQELRIRPVNTGLLRRVSEVSAGVFEPRPEDVYRLVPKERAIRPRILRPWLLGLAALLLIPETILRRISLRRR
jgi:hypothetical protein